MKRYLVDTNVVLDLLLDRAPFADDAAVVFDKVDSNDVELCLCALSYSNIYYVMRPHYGKEKTIEGLKKLAETVAILSVDDKVIEAALASDFTDFEDAIQYYSAIYNGITDGIITRNAKDFRLSEIPIISPTEFNGDATTM